MTSEISKYIVAHRQALNHVSDVLVSRSSSSPKCQINTFHPSVGNGYSDLYDFGRICLGRGQFCLKKPKQISAETTVYCFGLTIFLSGTFQIKNNNLNQLLICKSPTIVLRKGCLGFQSINLPQNQQMSLISIDFDQNLLHDFIQSKHLNNIVRFFLDQNAPCLQQIDSPNSRIIYQSQYILNSPSTQNEIELLHLEGAALELLGLLLQENNNIYNEPHLVSIEKTISIMDKEFDQKITIPQLAKRVGLNECDLKRCFKQYTNKTIGNYLLTLRMQHAMFLLKNGSTIQEVAYKTGYNNVH
ncbi:helix-turn-helix transcriptional regulator, partial [Acinetobacter qingfengensis]